MAYLFLFQMQSEESQIQAILEAKEFIKNIVHYYCDESNQDIVAKGKKRDQFSKINIFLAVKLITSVLSHTRYPPIRTRRCQPYLMRLIQIPCISRKLNGWTDQTTGNNVLHLACRSRNMVFILYGIFSIFIAH